MRLFKKQKINYDKLPGHIAFIIDGNGRWAKKRGLKRTIGHKHGISAVDKAVDFAHKIGMKIISFYCFSTENWNRPKEEVDEIFRLMSEFLQRYKQKFIENKLKLKIVGDITRLPEHLQNDIIEVLAKTQDNNGLVVNIALNYGSRVEIINAINKIIEDKVQKVDDVIFREYLQTQDLPDPDMVVRTSGEHRLSNFMMYQCAYSELYFPKIYWPDFNEKYFKKAILEYQRRDRRFGAIKT